MTPPFKLIPDKRSEIEIQRDIMRYLQNERRVKWFCRLNGGATPNPGGRFIHFYTLCLRGCGDLLHKGYSDLHGMLEGGRYFALEVKRPQEKPTTSQSDFIHAVIAGGGIAAVVTNWEEAKNALFQ